MSDEGWNDAHRATPEPPQHYSVDKPCPFEERFEEHMRVVHSESARASTVPAGLDVEVLAKALHRVFSAHPDEPCPAVDGHRRYAGPIVAEYNRLADARLPVAERGAGSARASLLWTR